MRTLILRTELISGRLVVRPGHDPLIYPRLHGAFDGGRQPEQRQHRFGPAADTTGGLRGAQRPA